MVAEVLVVGVEVVVVCVGGCLGHSLKWRLSMSLLSGRSIIFQLLTANQVILDLPVASGILLAEEESDFLAGDVAGN